MSKAKMNNQSIYSISAKIEGSPRIIKIHDEIGGWGVWAQDFIAELEGLDENEITLDLFTPGGSIYHGMQIIKAIQNHPAKFTAKIDSFVGSMGTAIACACDFVQMSKLGTYWIHRAQGVALGDAEEILKYGEDLGKLESQLIKVYVEKTGKSEDELSGWMAEDRPWTAEEAKSRGFIDEIYDDPEGSKASNIITPALLSAVMQINRVNHGQDTLGKWPLQHGIHVTTFNSHEKPSLSGKTQTENNMDNEKLKKEVEGLQAQLAAAEQDKAKAVQEAERDTAERIAAINSIGDKFGFQDEAKAFIGEKKTVDAFRAHVLEKSVEEWRESLQVKNPSGFANQQLSKLTGRARVQAAFSNKIGGAES